MSFGPCLNTSWTCTPGTSTIFSTVCTWNGLHACLWWGGVRNNLLHLLQHTRHVPGVLPCREHGCMPDHLLDLYLGHLDDLLNRLRLKDSHDLLHLLHLHSWHMLGHILRHERWHVPENTLGVHVRQL